jgi:hypothetical protein
MGRRLGFTRKWVAARRQAAAAEGRAALVLARRVWHALTPHARRTLTAEIVATRGAELVLAYPDVLALAHGYRTKCVRGRRRLLQSDPAVTFLVRRKWKRGHPAKKKARRAVPKYLLTYITVADERVLCAVPTDVESAPDYRLTRPVAAVRAVPFEPGPRAEGSVAVPVRVPQNDVNVFLMGCVHVLELTAGFYPRVPDAVSIQSIATGTEVATSTRFFGLLSDGHLDSFDAALCRLTDPTLLPAVLGGRPRASSFARSAFEIPDQLDVWTSAGRRPALKGKVWDGAHPLCVSYAVPGGRISVCHRVLIELAASIGPGDSGSPVMAGNLFVGMVIASNLQDRAFMIPSSELMDASNYKGLGAGALTLA